jgi:5-methylcytosine-specific restriction endonuclease McrA
VHGGTDEFENLALACAHCNRKKGRRHDRRRADDPRAREVIAYLQGRRHQRWRELAR